MYSLAFQQLKYKIHKQNNMPSGNRGALFTSDEINHQLTNQRTHWLRHTTCASWYIRISCNKLSVTSHFPDFLSTAEMGEVVDRLSQQPFERVQCLAYSLGFTKGEFTEKSQGRSIKDLLFFLLLEWKRRSPTNTKQSLALLIMSCGHYTEALRLDPTCMFWWTIVIFLQSWRVTVRCVSVT